MHDKRLRLLMGIPHPDAKGGPPTHIPMLVEYFRESNKYEVKTIYYGSKSFGTERGHRETVLKKVVVTLGKLIEYLYLLATFRPHIVHFNTAFTNNAILRDCPFAVVSRTFGQKSIFKLHGCHLDLLHTDNRIRSLIISLFFSCATKVGVLSNAEKEEISQRFGYSDKLVLTKNIVEPVRVTTTSGIFSKQADSTYGLFVSRIDALKGLQDLVRALPAILEVVPNFRLVVAGDGPDRDSCEQLAMQLNVDSCITWLGYIENELAQSLYRQCDVFVFPTHYPEGMPMVLIDAVNAGIPIVTTPVWFGLSYLQDGKNCVYVERGNPDDLSDKILGILEDSSLRSTMRRENPSLLSQFGKTTVGQEFDEIYQRMLDGR